MTDFGVIICTCKFDFFLAKACVASVRHSLGNVPITLFIDDDLEVGPFAKYYDIKVMYRRDVRDPWLRSVNTGWGLPKMTLFWESPYDHFLYLDCDTIVCGDVVKAHLQPFDADIVFCRGDSVSHPWSPEDTSDERIERGYFNPSLMEKVFPAFPWRKYRQDFFCTGVFAAKKNCLQLAAYRQLIEVSHSTPGLFPSGEMPLLNFMIFDAQERGELKVRYAPIQAVCDWASQDFCKNLFLSGPSSPEVACPAPIVLHFTDPKPLASSVGFKEPVQYFREKCAREYLGVPPWLSGIYTRLEEMEWRLRIGYRKQFGAWHSRMRKMIRGFFNGNSR